jgi:glutamate-1-semialdehyde 2,1-aminomutase
MGSTRLPNKVLRPICGIPMIGLLLQRLSRAKRVDQIVVATAANPRNAPLVEYASGLGYSV